MNSFTFNRQSTITYNVSKGDNLYEIANKYNTTVEEIMKLNNLSSTNIYPDQTLFIPYMGQEGIMYKEYLTEPGDTFEIIEKKSGVDLDMLSQYNDLTKLELLPNQIIKLPYQEAKTYVILPEDNLELILQKTNLTPRELIMLNEKEWLKTGNTIIVG